MTQEWTIIGTADMVIEDDVVGIDINGKSVAVYSVDGDVYATDNICTHGNARLCDGFLEGHEIECPLHQGKFDVRDGKATCAPITEDLRSYPIKIEEGNIYIAF